MATSQPPPTIRAYRDFLTPLLHRRFTDASLLVLGACWVEAALLSSSSLLWTCVPFSVTGLRTLLLFIPCLAVFVVRLTDLHLGARTAIVDTTSFRREFVSVKAAMIVAWYFFSAGIFGEVYIWSKGHEANLGWVDYGRAYERPRLNENPMILRSLYLTTAGVAAFSHIFWDKGHVEIEQASRNRAIPGSLMARLPIAVQAVVAQAAPIGRYAFDLSLAGFVTTLFTYHLLFRSVALSFARLFGPILNNQLPHNAGFVGIIEFGSFVWQAATSVLLLTFLWSFSNSVFSAYLAQPPLKKGHPLTSEVRDNSGRITSRSSDPNASLLTGLRSKKNAPHTFALWELSLICSQFEARRKTIFLEVDKTGGSTWAQISQQCLAEINAINARINAYQTKGVTPSSQPQAAPNAGEQSRLQGLPEIATEKAKQGDILNKPLPDLANRVSDMARSAGSHPNAQSPLSPVAKRAVSWSKERLLTKEQQANFTSDGLHKGTSSKLLEVLRTPVGAPFRLTFAQVVKFVVFGTPYSAKNNIGHASSALSALLKASLVEDTCGIVAKDVPTIINTFTSTIGSIKQFVRTTQPHWTDVYFVDSHRQIPEVTDVIVELQSSLETMLLAFSEYASAVGIGKKELRQAKEAIGMHERQEMIKV